MRRSRRLFEALSIAALAARSQELGAGADQFDDFVDALGQDCLPFFSVCLIGGLHIVVPANADHDAKLQAAGVS